MIPTAMPIVRLLEFVPDDVGEDMVGEADGAVESVNVKADSPFTDVDSKTDGAVESVNGAVEGLDDKVGVGVAEAAIVRLSVASRALRKAELKLTGWYDSSRLAHLTIALEHVVSNCDLRWVTARCLDLISDQIVVVGRAAVAETRVRCQSRAVAAAGRHTPNDRGYSFFGTLIKLAVFGNLIDENSCRDNSAASRSCSWRYGDL